MKYVPLNNQPNISGSRLESISPSLRMDDRGFPCVSWLDEGNNINEVNYSYWDGLKWSFYEIPKVYVSSANIVFSPNALVLDSYGSPVIAFARRIGGGYRLSLASYSSGWNFSNYDVDYNVGWIGVIKTPDNMDSSSSSSSSSAAIHNNVYYVAVYDSDNERFIVFVVDGANWNPVSAMNAVVENFESVKIDVCGRKMGIAYVVSYADLSSSSSGSSGYFQGIKYDFFDLDSLTWSFPLAFRDLNTSLLYGEIIDMDMAGYWDTNSIMAFGWVSRTSDISYICSVLADDTGTETPSDNTDSIINAQIIDVSVSPDYVVNGYRKIALCVDDSNLIRMSATGAASNYFRLVTIGPNLYWTMDSLDVEGISSGIVPTYVRLAYSDDTKLVMATDSGDVYYFEESADASFPLSDPSLVLLTDQWAYTADYSSGRLNGMDIGETYDNKAGGILTDSEKPLLITSNRMAPITTTTTLPPQWAFTQRDSIRNWFGVASSSDGVKLVAGVSGGYIYTSTNSGLTWTPRDSARTWTGIASSADGTKLVAGVINPGGQIYTSTDSGLTWTPRGSIGIGWYGVASSSDGVKLVATAENGYIYTSTNSGLTWTPRDSIRGWHGVASSSDGTKLVAADVNPSGYIYTSTNSGLTWTPRDSDRRWWCVASSSDGVKLVAGVYGGQIYTSTDSGLTWTPRDSARNWFSVASSSDGTKLAATVYNGNIYTSTDSGLTWTPRDSIRGWSGVASSSSGTKLIMGTYPGYLYTGVYS